MQTILYLLQEKCKTMSREEVIQRLCMMAKYSPLLWAKIDAMPDKEVGDGTMDEDTNGADTPRWCICGLCREMPDERQRICCQNATQNHEHPFFEHHILLEATLELAMRNNADHLYYPFDPSNPACWCFTAYRQYCLWVWGKLGKSNRKVIPSCVVWKIRNRFPDPKNVYTGFFDVEYNL